MLVHSKINEKYFLKIKHRHIHIYVYTVYIKLLPILFMFYHQQILKQTTILMTFLLEQKYTVCQYFQFFEKQNYKIKKVNINIANWSLHTNLSLRRSLYICWVDVQYVVD